MKPSIIHDGLFKFTTKEFKVISLSHHNALILKKKVPRVVKKNALLLQ